MKKYFIFFIFQISSLVTFAQYWASTGTSLYSTMSSTSYVGIGIIPQYKLDVNGKLCIRPEEIVAGKSVSYLNWTGHILNIGTPTGVYAYNYLDFKPGGATEGPVYSIFRMYTATSPNNQYEKIHFASYGDCWMSTDGNFGIGTMYPNYTLDVRGTIRANEILVNTTGADFVFEKDYELMPLDQLKDYIENNHHLPQIQSAEDMQDEGVGVGELQTKLLQKIEELTLYIIQQKETIDELRNEIIEQKKQ